MDGMTLDEQLKTCFNRLKNGGKQSQLRWCTVTALNEKEKTIDVTGESDGLEYFDVSLGLGAMVVYPKLYSECLIGIVEGKETDAFLIAAAEIDSIEIVSDKIKLNGGGLKGMVMVKELTNVINKMVDTFNAHTHPASGGTTSPSVLQMNELQDSAIENKNIMQ